MNMICKKPLEFIFAILLSLGLFLSPFSFSHASLSHASMAQDLKKHDISQLPCHAINLDDVDGSDTPKAKSPLPCCVSACVAFILPFELPIFREGNNTQKPHFGLAYHLKGIVADKLIRPPMAFV